MKLISILNDVLGPVMHGPSSSHTAGSYHIGRLARSLFGEEPVSAEFTFDPNGSYAKVYHQQGSDLGFVAGILNWPITDERFKKALEIAEKEGKRIQFQVSPFAEAEHPNDVKIHLISSKGNHFSTVAQSIGGGMIRFKKLEDWEVDLNGTMYDVLAECDDDVCALIASLLTEDGFVEGEPLFKQKENRFFVMVRRKESLKPDMRERLKSQPGVRKIWFATPVYSVKKGEPLFNSAEGIIMLSDKEKLSMGELARRSEAHLLGLSEEAVTREMLYRYEIMQTSIRDGFREENSAMQLLHPSAGKIYRAEAEGRVAVGGSHTKAAARAMAAMHTANSMGVVCAAPTGGSAGVIPGVIQTLAEDKRLSDDLIARSLFAAGAVGAIVAERATFAAEIAGCQVEIGAAGAMAAAAVVEAVGGTARQAADAAAIALQNSMGSVCDLVRGMCEVPCHTRNAAAASSAFVCADLVLGGYENPIPLDETIDAIYSVGKMMPRELRCTSLGGLAVTPAALKLHIRSVG